MISSNHTRATDSRFNPFEGKIAWLLALSIVAILAYLSFGLGRDTPWDYFSYHAYAAYSLFHDRLDQDYFAAGLQGYMNPIGFLPFALTQLAGFNSIQAGMTLTCLHALNGVLLLLLCRDLARNDLQRVALLLPGLVLGFMSPILLTHIGSTFIDPIGSALVIGALWLTLTRQSKAAHTIAGLLIGVSLAIKLSNLVFAVAIGLAMAWPWRESPKTWLVRCACGAGGMLLGFLILQGHWSWHLYQTTGNPLFPFFNNIFHSPLIPTNAPSVGRFVPSNMAEVLTTPLQLARFNSWAHLELPAPTLVPLAACSLFALWLIWRGTEWLSKRTAAERPLESDSVKYGIFLVVSAVLWLVTSGNARYAIALFVALGPATALLCGGLFPRRYALLAIWLILASQLFMTWDAGIKRWRSQQWTRDWLAVQVPNDLRARPYLFISLMTQAHSEIVPHLHPESPYVHLNNGHYSVPSQGPASKRLWQLIGQYDGRTKILLQRPWKVLGTEVPDSVIIAAGNNYLDRVGLTIDADSCQDIFTNGEKGLDIRRNKLLSKPREVSMMACNARRMPSRFEKERRWAEHILDAYEDKCKGLFQPARPQIEKVGDIWVRIYPKYDSAVLILSPPKKYISYLLTGQFQPVVIGRPDTWQQDLAKFDCRMPYDGKRGFNGFVEEQKSYDHGID